LIFKRGMVGVYEHCGEQHLQRCLSEFDFRYPNRSASRILGPPGSPRRGRGKRLTYRRARSAQRSFAAFWLCSTRSNLSTLSLILGTLRFVDQVLVGDGGVLGAREMPAFIRC
jgi:hypothetical protein